LGSILNFSGFFADNRVFMIIYGVLRRGGITALLVSLFLIFLPVNIGAEVMTLVSPESKGGYQRIIKSRDGYFPGIYFTDVINAARIEEDSNPYWVYTQAEHEILNRVVTDYTSLLLNNDILAFYGHPRSERMGILGRYSIEELDKRLTKLAGEYEAESGGRKVLKAIYIIFGTV
jgi:hypothetical protein